MMINETKLQIPDEYKEKIQVIYKDKDGYWAYLGYGLCWKEKELQLISSVNLNSLHTTSHSHLRRSTGTPFPRTGYHRMK